MLCKAAHFKARCRVEWLAPLLQKKAVGFSTVYRKTLSCTGKPGCWNSSWKARDPAVCNKRQGLWGFVEKCTLGEADVGIQGVWEHCWWKSPQQITDFSWDLLLAQKNTSFILSFDISVAVDRNGEFGEWGGVRSQKWTFPVQKSLSHWELSSVLLWILPQLKIAQFYPSCQPISHLLLYPSFPKSTGPQLWVVVERWVEG